MCAHGSVVVSDDDATFAGGDFGVDEIFDMETCGKVSTCLQSSCYAECVYLITLLFALLSQDAGVLVVSHTANVPDRVGSEHVLGTSSGVLGGATGDQLCVAVVDEVFIQAHLVGLGKEGVVKFQTILLQHCLVTDGGEGSARGHLNPKGRAEHVPLTLNVEDGILQAEELE